MAKLPLSLRRRARNIQLLLLDVDGVLTDGLIYYIPDGRGGAREPTRFVETKTFHSRDGLGIRMAQRAGIKIGLLSGRSSPVVRYRAQELGLDFVHEGQTDKLPAYEAILKDSGLTDDQVCYVGDDVVDLPVLRRVGMAVTVSDCHPAVERDVHYQTRQPGGKGAVREVIDLILAAQGKLETVSGHFFRDQRSGRRR